MKLASLSLVLIAAAACGGKSKPATTGNTSTAGGGGGGVPAEWSAVLVDGATFTLDNQAGDPPAEDPFTVHATVAHVEKAGDAVVAELRWTDDGGEELAATGLPQQIKVSPAGVWFWSGGDELDAVFGGPPTFPAGADKTHRDGYYDTVTRADDGTVCYGWEPDENAGDCEDVCFASLCISAKDGIVSGEGSWWPNMEIFHKAAN